MYKVLWSIAFSLYRHIYLQFKADVVSNVHNYVFMDYELQGSRDYG
jgi:hypothetical protein